MKIVVTHRERANGRWYKTQQDPFFALATRPFWLCIRGLVYISWQWAGNKVGWRRELYVSLLHGKARFYIHDGSAPLTFEEWRRIA